MFHKIGWYPYYSYQDRNKATEVPQMTTPRFDEVLDHLSGGSAFSLFDFFLGLTRLTIHPNTIPPKVLYPK